MFFGDNELMLIWHQIFDLVLVTVFWLKSHLVIIYASKFFYFKLTNYQKVILD